MHVTLDEMRDRVGNPDVTILDVLSRESYAGAHLPGAVNIPFDELAERAVELPSRSQPIVVYCGGPT